MNNQLEGQGDDEFRHQCAVRYVINLRKNDRTEAMRLLNNWDEKHPGSRLRNDVMVQWSKGNRGDEGDWRD